MMLRAQDQSSMQTANALLLALIMCGACSQTYMTVFHLQRQKHTFC